VILQRNRNDLYLCGINYYAIDNSLAVAVDIKLPFYAQFMVSEIAFTIAWWMNEIDI